jgi:drug/metabolite transporter (DMT)-like permease
MALSPGLRYMLIATVFFSFMNVTVKLVPHIPAIEIVFFRSVVSFVISYLLLKGKSIPVFGNNKKLLISRGITGAIALILYFTTLQNVPLASAVTLQYLSPIFTTLLGIYLVKEKIRPLQLFFFVVSFGGIIMIEGFDPRLSLFYLLIGVTSAFFSGISYNIIRKLKQTEHPLVIVFYFPLVAAPIAGIYCLFNWVQPIGWDWLILISVGVFTQFAQYYMTKAYQSEVLASVANLNYLGIIYALGLGYVFFGETFNLMTYLGMTLVLVGVILNVNYSHQKNKKIVKEGEIGKTELK